MTPGKNQNPVRKGDYVAVRTSHTMHFADHRPPQNYDQWRIAKVASTDRAGFATAVIFAGDSYATQLKHHYGARPKVYTLRDYQEHAARLFALGAKSWESAEEIRDAIRDA